MTRYHATFLDTPSSFMYHTYLVFSLYLLDFRAQFQVICARPRRAPFDDDVRGVIRKRQERCLGQSISLREKDSFSSFSTLFAHHHHHHLNAMSDAEKPTTTPAADAKPTGLSEGDITKYKVRSQPNLQAISSLFFFSISNYYCPEIELLTIFMLSCADCW